MRDEGPVDEAGRMKDERINKVLMMDEEPGLPDDSSSMGKWMGDDRDLDEG